MKIINKILDNYYSDKLINIIYETLLIYFIDIKTIIKKERVEIFIKKPKYNDTMYQFLLGFDKQDAFKIICKYKDFEKEILKQAENILKIKR